LDIGRSNHLPDMPGYIVGTLPAMEAKSAFVPPKKKGRTGKKLPAIDRLVSKCTSLFYTMPEWCRKEPIRPWFANFVGVPRYLFRLPGKLLSKKQKVVSTLCRLYNLYRFRLCRGHNRTSWLIKSGRDDSIHRLLRVISRKWYTIGSIVYRRLKVLLTPIWS